MTLRSFFKSLSALPLWLIGIVILVVFFFLYARDLEYIVFLAYIVMAALVPFVDWMDRRHIPRFLSILLAYVLLLTPIILFFYFLYPTVAAQTLSFFLHAPSNLDATAKKLHFSLPDSQVRSFLIPRIADIFSQTLTIASSVVGSIFLLFTFFFVNFYLLSDYNEIHETLTSLSPQRSRNQIKRILAEIESKLRVWAQGQVVLSLFVGVLTWLALLLIGIPYALPIGIFAGFLEFVPIIGPFIGFAPAVILAIPMSFPKLLLTIGAYIIIQQLESNFLVPQIMHRALKLHPLVVLLGVLTGAKLFGIFGALFAVPILTIVRVIWQEIQQE